MSDALATIWMPNGRFIVGFGNYAGSSDILAPGLAGSRRGAMEKGGPSRRDGRNPWDVLDACDHEGEPAIIHTNYGGGFWWLGRYCGECIVILGPLDPWADGVVRTEGDPVFGSPLPCGHESSQRVSHEKNTPPNQSGTGQ